MEIFGSQCMACPFFEVRRTIECAEIWALCMAVCLLERHAVIPTDDLGGVQALKSGGVNCTCAKHNDGDWRAFICQQLRVIKNTAGT